MTNPTIPRVDAASGNAGKKIRIGVALLAVSAIAAALYLHFSDADSESTEDAYVDGNVVQVTPQLGGTVTRIAADNTEFVAAGQVLVQFNEADAKFALERSQAQLAHAVRQVRAQFANASQSGTREQRSSARSLLDQTSIANHPDVQAAVSQLRDAYLANARTTLRAPVSGIVSKRSVQLGQRVGAGAALMSIVPSEQMWVNANFKESQLRQLRIGQAVTLQADVYGSAVQYHGTVVGLDAGTGSAFSLLPAQNASGNWIKVVQRVPVRVAITPQELAAHPLKLGLSMRVNVDTTHRDGAVAMTRPTTRTNYRTDVFDSEMAQADELVKQIIFAPSVAAVAER